MRTASLSFCRRLCSSTAGYTVIAVANPLRGVDSDAAYAVTGNPNVKALVQLAAFAPDQGETSGQLANMFPGSGLTPANLVLRPYPLSGGATGTDGYIKPTAFHQVFCADVPDKTAATMGASQRPAELATLSQPSGIPAGRSIPSWYPVASQDRAIPPADERFMAQRMGAHTDEIDSSPVAMIVHPSTVADLIVSAVSATR